MTKQFILDEIKRIAGENGGKSPGRLTFYNRTGISENDWSGKYWSRWSDAVREAGFLPNQMNAGYEESYLIEKLVILTRELGRFPVSREIRLKAYNDRGFPSTKTFETRFGTKKQLLSKVLDYCRTRTELKDVLEICEQIRPNADKNEITSKTPEQVKLGVVYLIKSGRFYKIGKTLSVGRRIYDLALQLAEKPTTVHVIKTDDPEGIEKYWHQRFSIKRKGGEWFDLDGADVKAFKRWIKIV